MSLGNLDQMLKKIFDIHWKLSFHVHSNCDEKPNFCRNCHITISTFPIFVTILTKIGIFVVIQMVCEMVFSRKTSIFFIIIWLERLNMSIWYILGMVSGDWVVMLPTNDIVIPYSNFGPNWVLHDMVAKCLDSFMPSTYGR